ncbi:hypothetical protein HPB50_015929 [Hyalomma asiaticum]|uniref:Uncharacterized protein n=1 Tax=Hyalomma asiaticum TaxID=266040 RepID=A0ACB7RXQ7_HYAAI|nr:hypothetical protein HPB50_015929 [Hyalomma asiaticum]
MDNGEIILREPTGSTVTRAEAGQRDEPVSHAREKEQRRPHVTPPCTQRRRGFRQATAMKGGGVIAAAAHQRGGRQTRSELRTRPVAQRCAGRPCKGRAKDRKHAHPLLRFGPETPLIGSEGPQRIVHASKYGVTAKVYHSQHE